ncbi:DEKNAAC105457 [Brettanomyces naardenensis]|uniref:DEKNAAC105457 n=1 Tax=Brettanomyces naardenensis TaxID=13370 RepID=A0A448YTF5_BRENA|nr:DEKNAAC105457 [Brettanomyces naardenensis]
MIGGDQASLSDTTSTRKRQHRSKKRRPCDFCRKRKTCCIMPEIQGPCTTCSKRGIECVTSVSEKKSKSERVIKKRSQSLDKIRFYVPKPASERTMGLNKAIVETKRERKDEKDAMTGKKQRRADEENVHLPPTTSSIQHLLNDDTPKDSDISEMLQEALISPEMSRSRRYEFDLPLTADIWRLLFRDLGDSIDEDLVRASQLSQIQQKQQMSRLPQVQSSSSSYASSFHLQTMGVSRFKVPSEEEIERFTRRAIDADESIKTQFLTDNSCTDPFIYSKLTGLQVAGGIIAGKQPEIYPRQLSSKPNASALILVRRDLIPDHEEIMTKEKLRSLIGDYGPRLLLIFFQRISPFLPLFSRGLFYFGRNQNMLDFRNSLVSTLLTTAMDWWKDDPVLQRYLPPSDVTLFNIASSTMMKEQVNPNYSTLQACVLLSQKRPFDHCMPDTPFRWSLLGMAGSMAMSMGYNEDCSEWDIPHWNKRLRRRIWWTFVVQDTWFAASYGRPLHISRRFWYVSYPSQKDFEAYSMDDDEAENFRLSVVCFCYMTRLTEAVAQACEELTSTNTERRSFETTFEVGQVLLHRIVNLEEACPDCLQISFQKDCQTAWANGSVQVAIQSAKLFIYKHLIHRWMLCKESEESVENQEIVYRESLECLRRCLELVKELKPLHFKFFWYSWSRLNFALIANFALLLYSISKGENRAKVEKMILNYHRWLRISAPLFKDLSLALSILDNVYGEVVKFGD